MTQEDIKKITDFILKNGENDGVGTLVYTLKKCNNGMDCINVNVLEGTPFAFLSSERDDRQEFYPIDSVFESYEDFISSLNSDYEPKEDTSLFDLLLKHLGLYDEWVKQGRKGTIGGKDQRGFLYVFRNTDDTPYTLRAFDDLKTHNNVVLDFDFIWEKCISNRPVAEAKENLMKFFEWREQSGVDFPFSNDIIFDAIKPIEEKVFDTSMPKRRAVSKETYTRHEHAMLIALQLVKDLKKQFLATGCPIGLSGFPFEIKF